MALRILEADITAHVTTVLMNIKHGVEGARAQGLIADLPEKVDFQIEVVTDAQSLVAEETRTTTESDTLSRTTTHSIGARTTTATQSGTTTQTTTVTGGESGGDTITTSYTYS